MLFNNNFQKLKNPVSGEAVRPVQPHLWLKVEDDFWGRQLVPHQSAATFEAGFSPRFQTGFSPRFDIGFADGFETKCSNWIFSPF